MNDTKMRSALGILITLGFFGVIFFVLTQPIATAVRDIVLVLLGALIASFKEVTGFFFGSSSGSTAKDATIAAMNNAAGANGSVATVKIDDTDPVKVTETK